MPHAPRGPSANGHTAPSTNGHSRLTGHALRNAHLRERSLARAETAPPLARALVEIRAGALKMTRLEFARRSGIGRGTLRDVELGVHTPTRHTLQQFVAYCRKRHVSPDRLDALQGLYLGPDDTLERFIHRLELRAGSTRELARRARISPSTLWEYRRGNYPLPWDLLTKLCRSVGEDAAAAEALWHGAERQRLLDRGYPEAWAELCVLCARAGHTEGRLPELGVRTATFRKLCYLELPPWDEIADTARGLCPDDKDFQALKQLWARDEQEQHRRTKRDFGARLKQLRKRQGIARRELADLFGVGGKKPARIIKHIEEDGFYSQQAYPAGLAAVLTADLAERRRLLDLWRERRRQFHRRRRPETRADLRLAREQYGLELKDVAAVLGYTNAEYQKIERGVEPLLETGRRRILEAIDGAGERRVAALLQKRQERDAEQVAWQAPPSVAALVTLLSRREGGLAPLARFLRKSGVKGLSTERLRAVVRGHPPAWCVVAEIARACGVDDLALVRHDWEQLFRAQLQRRFPSPLGVEIRMLVAESAPSLRAFSPKLGFNYSVLVREFQRIDRDEPLRWYHVERILKAAGLVPDSESWREIHALWSTAAERRKKTPVQKPAAPALERQGTVG